MRVSGEHWGFWVQVLGFRARGVRGQGSGVRVMFSRSRVDGIVDRSWDQGLGFLLKARRGGGVVSPPPPARSELFTPFQ